MTKRSVAWLAVTILLISALLSACGGNSATEGQAPSGSAAGGSEPKPKEIYKMEGFKLGWGTVLPEAKDDFVKAEIDRRLGIDLKLTVPASVDDFANLLNTRFAAANYPDFIDFFDRNTFISYSEKGFLLDLTPYLGKLPNATEFLGEDGLRKGKVGGKQYGLAKAPNPPARSVWVRKDWLDHLQLPVPTTPDELLEVAKAFTYNDPDGNGKKDTYGVTGRTGSGPIDNLDGIMAAYGSTGVGPNFSVENGKLVVGTHDPRTRDGLAKIKEFYDAGVVDPDILANKDFQKALQGQAGIVFGDWASMAKDEIVQQMKTANPNAEWLQLDALKGPGGQYAGNRDIGQASGYLALPKSLESNPDKLEAVLALIDYVSSEEGLRLVQFGLQDQHYKLEDGKVKPTEQMGTEAGYVWVYQFAGRPEMEYLQVKFANQEKDIAKGIGQPRIDIYNSFITPPDGYNNTDAWKYIQEESTKFVYGKRPLSEYDDFLQTLDTTFKFKVYVEAAEQQLKALGYLP